MERILFLNRHGGCHSTAAADGTNTVPFSLEKTSEVLQCTSHLDPLGRGERDWVNDGNSKCKHVATLQVVPAKDRDRMSLL